MQTPPLFSPIHPDSKQLQATPQAEEPCAYCDPSRPGAAHVHFPLPPVQGDNFLPECPQSLSSTASEPLPQSHASGSTPRISGGETAAGAGARESSNQPEEKKGPSILEKMLGGESSSLDPSETSVNFREKFVDPRDIPLTEFSLASCFRHSGWAVQRRLVFESLKRTGQTASRVGAFSRCGANAYVKQSRLQEKDASGRWCHKYCISGDHCHDRLCTPCANLRSLKLRDALMRMVESRPVTFITLTLAGAAENLREKVDRLYKHFRALRLHPTWADNVRGGAAFLEIKYSDKARRWHPHLHIICEAKWIAQQDLCDAWRSITHDSFIVDIRAVKDQAVTASYVTKYASKPLNMSFATRPDLLDESVMALKGRRLCLTFGEWYGTPLTYAEDEELGDDVVDAGGYDTFCPLELLLQNALDGDAQAVQIVRLMNIWDRVEKMRKPPGG